MRVFQTFLLSYDLMVKYKLSFAAANFSKNLIRGGGPDRTFPLTLVNLIGDAVLRAKNGYEVLYFDQRKRKVQLSKLAFIRFLVVATLLKICYETVMVNPIKGNIPVYELIILFALFYKPLFGRLEKLRTKV